MITKKEKLVADRSSFPGFSYIVKKRNLSSFKKVFFIKTLYMYIFFSAMATRIVFRVSVLVLLLYSAVTQKCPASGRSESSIVGWMLRGHVYDTLLAELPFTCLFKCREDNRAKVLTGLSLFSRASLTTGQRKPGLRTSFQIQTDLTIDVI